MVYNMTKSKEILEFDIILNMLSEMAYSKAAKETIRTLTASLDQAEIILRQKETKEARILIDSIGLPPITAMKDMEEILQLTIKGSMLYPEQLTAVSLFLASCKRLKAYLKRAESLNVDIAFYGTSIHDLTNLFDEINLAIRNNQVEDSASKELKSIRRKMDDIQFDIKAKLEQIIRNKKSMFMDDYVSTRNGHYVLPVKKEYKNQFNGVVLDASQTGSTYFMQPTSIMKLEDELSLLKIDEENEIRKILYTLTALVHDNIDSITINMEAIQVLDFIFAKGKLSASMKAVPAKLNTDGIIEIINGRHPLLKADCVPLNFTLKDGNRGVVITGPNTGGKTVSLKTIGLFHLMAQCGLHIPCEKVNLPICNAVLCDIGDGQSISENLSTFSSHISNIINILEHSNHESLILLDELGSGTDPTEGMGIAIAILEELVQKKCLFVATTHYPQVKEYANQTTTIINARMAFDRETLKPLYQLEMGESGESCALYIAKRLGFPTHMLNRAYKEAYQNNNIIKASPITDSDLFSENDYTEKSMVAMTPTELKSVKKESQKEVLVSKASSQFEIGDSVMIYPQKKIGIVYKTANEKGEVLVQIKKEKHLINHKRHKINAKASDLYPEDYDFSIIFDSVANRKARHTMDRKHDETLEIHYDKEEFMK